MQCKIMISALGESPTYILNFKLKILKILKTLKIYLIHILMLFNVFQLLFSKFIHFLRKRINTI